MEMESKVDVDYEGSEVRLCTDGKYRWKYDLNMITNPIIYITVFKIFLYIILGGFVIAGTFFFAIKGDWEGLLNLAKISLFGMALFAILTFLGVLLVAAFYGGKYEVLFEMDETQIVHEQHPKQFKKAKKLGAITAVAGAASGRLTTAGAGALAATHNKSVTEFEKVRRVKPLRGLHVIKVNAPFDHNQVYTRDEDFDFVYDFIMSRCTNAK